MTTTMRVGAGMTMTMVRRGDDDDDNDDDDDDDGDDDGYDGAFSFKKETCTVSCLYPHRMAS